MSLRTSILLIVAISWNKAMSSSLVAVDSVGRIDSSILWVPKMAGCQMERAEFRYDLWDATHHIDCHQWHHITSLSPPKDQSKGLSETGRCGIVVFKIWRSSLEYVYLRAWRSCWRSCGYLRPVRRRKPAGLSCSWTTLFASFYQYINGIKL